MHIDKSGDRVWENSNGELHRIDGPARESSDGTKAWFLNDVHHRANGPATECTDGHKEWWFEGKRHRLDGPAVEHSNGSKDWWINYISFNKEEFNSWIKRVYEIKNNNNNRRR